MRPIIPLLALPLLIGCAPLPEAYVRADRLTYQAIAPEYRAYLADDAKLSESQQRLRLQTLDAWALRLQTAEVNDE